MKKNNRQDAFSSKYVIDGVKLDVTPEDMLGECMLPSSSEEDFREGAAGGFAEIWDESVDVPPENLDCSAEDVRECIEKVTGAAKPAQDRIFDVLYPESFARQRVAASLIDTLWIEGEYRLEDLELWAEWSWNSSEVGNMAAFYNSVQSVSEYIYDLGVVVEGYCYEEDGDCVNSYFATVGGNASGDGEYDADPEEAEEVADKDWEEDDMSAEESRLWTVGGGSDVNLDKDRNVWMGEERLCAAHLVADGGAARSASSASDGASEGTGDCPQREACAGSFLVYVPFDTCPPRLGGSLLARTLGKSGGVAPALNDPDYFIDCYEVVRDLVSDGVVLSARTVCDGGLAVAARKLSADSGLGVRLNLGGVSSAYGEGDLWRLLFAETPGVLLQVSDDDSDYIDSQFLLQDVAYYRIGRVEAGTEGVEVLPLGNGVDRILTSLLDSAASEGED